MALGAAPGAGAQAPAAPDTGIVTIGPALPAAGDSLRSAAGAAPDTAALLTIPARQVRTLPKVERFDRPKWVMLRSLAIPGWGQAHNGAWVKAGLVAAGDGYLRVTVFREQKELRNLNDQANSEYVDLLQADAVLTQAEADLAAAEAELAAAEAEVPQNPARIAAAQAAVAAAQTALDQANLARSTQAGEYNAAVIAYNTLFDGSVARRWLMVGVILFSMIDAYVDAHFKNFDVNLDVDPALPGGTGFPKTRLRLRWTF